MSIKADTEKADDNWIKEVFSQNLKARLKALHMSQRDLAKKMNVSDVQVSRWVSGVTPYWTTIAELCEILKVTPAYFLVRPGLIEDIDKAIQALGKFKQELMN